MLTLYPAASGTFAISTANAGANYPTSYSVTYNGTQYPQSTIPVPTSVMTSQTTNLGTITAYYYDPNNPNNPPPPPY